MTLQEIKDNYDIFQDRYSVYKDNGLDFFENRRFILDKTGPVEEDILDIGSGRGITVLALAGSGYHVSTIDTNEEMLKITALNLAYRDLLWKADLYLMDAFYMNFTRHAFNTVFMIEVLHHLDNLDMLLTGVNRVLAPGGRLVLADFNEKGKGIIENVHSSEGRRHEGSFSGKNKAEKWLTDKGYHQSGHEDACHWLIIADKPSQ